MDEMTSKRKPRTENELFKILNHAWKHMDKEKLKNLVKLMQSRCKQVIENNGYPTKY
jgi:hypothetical protein